MTVTLLYFDGCPSWRLARDRLIEAVRHLGLDEDAVVCRDVTNPEEANQLSFRGSPTVLIDGRDPFPGGEPAAALACRVYDTAAGPDQAPTVEQLVAALQR